jgi:hypothetical protein
MVGNFIHEQKQLALRLRARGWQLVDVAREIGCTAPMVGLMAREGRFTKGIPDQWEPRPGCLGIAEREEILAGLHAGKSLSAIARHLCRPARRPLWAYEEGPGAGQAVGEFVGGERSVFVLPLGDASAAGVEAKPVSGGRLHPKASGSQEGQHRRKSGPICCFSDRSARHAEP